MDAENGEAVWAKVLELMPLCDTCDGQLQPGGNEEIGAVVVCAECSTITKVDPTWVSAIVVKAKREIELAEYHRRLRLREERRQEVNAQAGFSSFPGCGVPRWSKQPTMGGSERKSGDDTVARRSRSFQGGKRRAR